MRCPYCSKETEVVWVHGHGQCEFCKVNIDECHFKILIKSVSTQL